MIVADASVILKWVLPDEELQEEALALRERHLSGEDSVAAPELLWYEISNVLPARWRNPTQVSNLFLRLHATAIETYPFDAPQFCRAMEIAHQQRVTAYDASYLVLAEALHCRLVTADERLVAHLKGFPGVVLLGGTAR
jgi:predicted nucleic acid-binding protein